MRICTLTLCATLVALAGPLRAAEWEIVDLRASTRASRCLPSAELAATDARERIQRDAVSACRAKGYGWSLEKIREEGKLACNECGGGATQCRVVDLGLQCERLKPGSVGMGMIPFWGGKEGNP